MVPLKLFTSDDVPTLVLGGYVYYSTLDTILNSHLVGVVVTALITLGFNYWRYKQERKRQDKADEMAREIVDRSGEENLQQRALLREAISGALKKGSK